MFRAELSDFTYFAADVFAWTSITLLGAYLAGRFLGFRSPALRHRIHLTALGMAMALLPILALREQRVGLLTWKPEQEALTSAPHQGAQNFGTKTSLDDPQPRSRPVAIAPASASAAPSEDAVQVPAPRAREAAESAPGRRTPWLLIAWPLGAGIILAVYAGGRHRARRIITRSLGASPDLRARLRRLGNEIGLNHPPELRESADIESPLLLGTRAPTILLPAGLKAKMEAGPLDALLVHELIHVRRKDAWIQLLVVAARSVLWPNPLVWVIGKSLAKDREVLTDAEVVRREDRRADYAEGLLKILDQLSPSPGAEAAALGVADGHADHLRARLDFVLTPGSPAHGRLSRRAAFAVPLIGLLTLTPASWLGVAPLPSGQGPSMSLLQATQEELVIELTEPLPADGEVEAPALAAAWPPARRLRASRNFVNGADTPRSQLKAALIPFGIGVVANRSPSDPTLSRVRARIRSSSKRDFADVQFVINLLGDTSIGIREIRLESMPEWVAPAPPQDVANQVQAGIQYLLRTQREDGRWNSGRSNTFEVGVTGLALLTLLSSATSDPRQAAAEHRAIAALQGAQSEDGSLGNMKDRQFSYEHAIGTLALSEALTHRGYEELRAPVGRAVKFCLHAQNPGQAWRYGVRPGDNDTSVTGWMLMALKSAKLQGIEVPSAELKRATDFLAVKTDPETGRTGYMVQGERPVRTDAMQGRFPAELSESLTAEALFVRILHGQPPSTTPALQLSAELLRTRLPKWSPTEGAVDYIYWYFGTLAMLQVGGEGWREWATALPLALGPAQATSGPEAGSFALVDPWSQDGGATYTTALCTMSLAVLARFQSQAAGK